MGCLRLGTTGLGSHVNSCIRLIDKAAESRSARHIDEVRCREGWRIFHSGNLTQPVDYIEKCVDHFAGRSDSTAMCAEGWKKEGAKSDFVDHCLSFVKHRGEGFREMCRVGWTEQRANIAGACGNFMKLTARNPRAAAVAAWVMGSFRYREASDVIGKMCT